MLFRSAHVDSTELDLLDYGLLIPKLSAIVNLYGDTAIGLLLDEVSKFLCSLGRRIIFRLVFRIGQYKIRFRFLLFSLKYPGTAA